MRLMIVRHADPDYVHDTLTTEGFLESDALADFYRDFSINYAYSSPYPRALLTANRFLTYHPEVKLSIRDWLHEFDYLVQVPFMDKPVISWDFLPREYVKENLFFRGEDYLDSTWLKDVQAPYRSVIREFDGLLAQHGYVREGRLYKVVSPSEASIVIFCHFGTLSILLSRLLNIPYVQLAQSFICAPSGVTTLVSEEREKGLAQFRLTRYGDITHLTVKGMKPGFAGRFCERYEDDERH